ncbi:amidohydrolase family protein [Desulfobulbus alkaliphilus]|uniref:amidohydrolase family protein n=1 Tax=Desulfobulbus alkaliphilus TaxID=869814 RepID=UPI001964A4A4|nr:amidohydrolase family protein [Desulfobulbus alkaliphilus]MBM9536783.1 amidohydrolase [Desulfobulbus alkaliphilus]
MPGYIDFHTHAFPDQIASFAIPALEKEGNIKAHLNGTISALLASMDRCGIVQSVVCSIATRPEQFNPILEWSKAIRSTRIVPFPSLHPADPLLLERLQLIHAEGFKGIKMHSYYQDYDLDDPSLDDLYAALLSLDMILVIHAGYDIAFPRIRRADPRRILEVCRRFPGLKLIATHLGGWDEWDDVRRLLTGEPVYMELSFALGFLDQDRLREILLAHPQDYLLFGTDSPWTDQATTLDLLTRMELPPTLVDAITRGNARRLLSP